MEDEGDHGVGEGCMFQSRGHEGWRWPQNPSGPSPGACTGCSCCWSSQGLLTLPLSSDHFLTTCCMSGTLLRPGHPWRQVHTGGKEPPGGGMKKPWQALFRETSGTPARQSSFSFPALWRRAITYLSVACPPTKDTSFRDDPSLI